MNVPPFVHAPKRWADNLSQTGAHALARTIERVWREHGHNVRCTVHKLSEDPLTQDGKGDLYVVRSDLRNGLPAGRE